MVMHAQSGTLILLPCISKADVVLVPPSFLCVQIAEHVLGQHRYRPAGDDGKSVSDDALIDSLEDRVKGGDTAVRVKYDARLYGPRKPGQRDPLSLPFLKKYIAFAKQRFAAPELTPEASEAIAEYYAELRNSAEVKALPVTVRTLETLIRLACAHAKVRLSAFVETSDVQEVMTLMDLIMKSDPSANEVRKAVARREDGRSKRPRGADGDDSDSSSSDDEEDAAPGGAAAAGRAAGMDVDGEEAGARSGEDSDEDDAMEVQEGAAGGSHAAEVDVEEEMSPGGQLRETIRAVVMELGQANSGAASVTGISAVLKDKKVKATRRDIMAVLQELEADEKIMLDGEEFYVAS